MLVVNGFLGAIRGSNSKAGFTPTVLPQLKFNN